MINYSKSNGVSLCKFESCRLGKNFFFKVWKPDQIIIFGISQIMHIIAHLLRLRLHKLASSISSSLHPQFLKAQFCFVTTRESRCSTEKRPWCLEVACGCQLVQLVMLPSLSWWYAFEKRHSNGHLKFCNLTKSVQIFLFSKPAAEKEENKNRLCTAKTCLSRFLVKSSVS